MPAKHVEELCNRCNALEADLIIRTEPLCNGCFSRFIHMKTIKRMEAFRTRHLANGQERKLLLPLSFGVSSVSLLHILDLHLQDQMQKTGRTGFSLFVLHIACPEQAQDLENEFARIQQAYPKHKFIQDDVKRLFTKEEDLTAILQRLPSATSVADVLNLLRIRRIVQIAKEEGCEGILWGDSTTKLAQTVLAETAKGRGFALPWSVTDGPSPYRISFYYPMRDVLKKELISYAKVTDPPLERLINENAFQSTQAPPSAKNTTIDILMEQYFEDVEENYPNIVSNVVRTTGKLQAPLGQGGVRCRLCDLPVEASKMGIEGWGGHHDAETEDRPPMGLCYGCSRSLPIDAIPFLPAASAIP